MGSPGSLRTMVPARLGLWDTVSIIVGIIIGIGIFKTPTDVFGNVSSAGAVLAIWTLGGLVSLIGALCFAELAAAYPRSGGEYVYLTRAFGPSAGFYFAWAQLAVIRTGNIGMLAFYLAEAAGDPTALWLPVIAVVGLTLLNTVGAEEGRWTQNVLTVVKVLGLTGIVLAGLFLVRAPAATTAVSAGGEHSLITALVAVLYSYLGWNEAAYVAREVREPRRNLPLSLIVGTLAVMVIYLGVNAAYLVGLGFDGTRAIHATPADISALAFGPLGGQVVNLLIFITVLGSLNAMIMTGSRIFSAMGRDHDVFRPLSRWHTRWHTPFWSLAVQAAWSIALIVVVSVYWREKDGFNVLLAWTTPVFWLFFLLTGLSIFVLRQRDPQLDRPFRVPLYPLLPALFCLFCAYMLIAALVAKPRESLAGLAVLLAGVPVQLFSLYLSRRWATADSAGAPEPSQRGLQEMAALTEVEPR